MTRLMGSSDDECGKSNDSKFEMATKVTKVIKKERKLKVFEGTDGPSSFRAWREEAEAALETLGYTGEEAARHLFDYLGTDVKREIKLAHGESAKSSAENLLEALRSIYGDKRTLAQRRTAFHNCRQHVDETILTFSHRLLGELEAMTELDKSIQDKAQTKMVKEQFTENVRDRQLRWELKKKNDNNITFKDLRQVAIEWSEQVSDSSLSDGRSFKSRAARADDMALPQASCGSNSSIDPVIEARFQKIEGQLGEQSSALQTVLAQQQQMIDQLREIKVGSARGGRGFSSNRNCFLCGEPGHFKVNCPNKKEYSGNGVLPGHTSGGLPGRR